MKRGIVPLAVEFLEIEPITLTEEHIRKKWPTKLGRTHLLVILDAASDEEMDRLSQAVAEICCEKGAIDVFIADTPSKQDDVLAIRSKIYDAIKAGTVEILDIAVPRAEVAGPRPQGPRGGGEVRHLAPDLRPRRRRQRPHPHHEGPLRERRHGARARERVAAQGRPRPRGALPRLPRPAAASSRASTASAWSRSPISPSSWTSARSGS